MSNSVRASRLAVMMAVGALLSPDVGHAQTGATTVVQFTLTISINVTKLHPSIAYVRPECEFYLEGGLLAQVPILTVVGSSKGLVGEVAVSALPQSVVRKIEVKVPSDAGGKAGSYTCYLKGYESYTSPEVRFDANPSDVRYKIAAGSTPTVSGTFVF